MDKRQINNKFSVVIDNTREARAILEAREFSPLRFSQGKKFLIANRSDNANKDGHWYTYHYETEDFLPKYEDIKTLYCGEDLYEFMKLLDELKPPIDEVKVEEERLLGLIKHFNTSLQETRVKLEALYNKTPTK